MNSRQLNRYLFVVSCTGFVHVFRCCGNKNINKSWVVAMDLSGRWSGRRGVSRMAVIRRCTYFPFMTGVCANFTCISIVRRETMCQSGVRPAFDSILNQTLCDPQQDGDNKLSGRAVLNNNKMTHLILYILSMQWVTAALCLPVTRALYEGILHIYAASTRNLCKGGQDAM
jgi:hypothetical protein